MKSMKKIVVFNHFGEWKMTTYENYSAYIMDANKCCTLIVADAKEAVECIRKYYPDAEIIVK
jgi:hypothetical protein